MKAATFCKRDHSSYEAAGVLNQDPTLFHRDLFIGLAHSYMLIVGSPCDAVCVAKHVCHVKGARVLQCVLQCISHRVGPFVAVCVAVHICHRELVCYIVHAVCCSVCCNTCCLRRDHYGNYDAGTRIHDKSSLPIDRNQLTENIALGFGRQPGARQAATRHSQSARLHTSFFFLFKTGRESPVLRSHHLTGD